MLVALLLLGLFCFSSVSWADEIPPEQNQSPYFLIQGDPSNVDSMPLHSTSAEVSIAGVIADVKVTQRYKNVGKKPLEAIYVFPASGQTAVYGMTMTIGERVIRAQIQRREDARQNYEQAKTEGKSAALLEEHRPNVFQMNVANILPGDEIQVELQYTELLVPEAGLYSFVYPTVVGPRYSTNHSSQVQAPKNWVKNPHLPQGADPLIPFQIQIHLSGGLPIEEMTSPSHSIQVEYNDQNSVSAQLKDQERNGGNRDFILQYRLQGSAIESGLLLHRGEEENFFLLMMQPPTQVAPSEVPPREYLFVVDVSGSMKGFPLDVTKSLLNNLVKSLRPVDRFNVLLFAGTSAVMAPRSLSATPENLQRFHKFIAEQQGGGGTQLLPAMKQAFQMPQANGSSRTMVIVTDGYIDVEEEVFELIREKLGDTNIFTFGIGSSVNRHLIEGMARVGMGEPLVVLNEYDASIQAEKFRKYIQYPVLTDIQVDFGDFEIYDLEPPHIPDLFAERPVVLVGKWKGNAEGIISLKGRRGDSNFSKELVLSPDVSQTSHQALPQLWARKRIEMLSDFNKLIETDQRIEQVTALGLKHSLLTKYTSFLAVDERIRNPNEAPHTVQQPLPLPQNVANSAVGTSIPGTPEPEEWLMILLAFAILAFTYFRKRTPWPFF